MTERELPPLDDDLAALLRSERLAPRPPPASAAKVMGRVARTIAMLPIAGAAHGGQGGGSGGEGGAPDLSSAADPALSAASSAANTATGSVLSAGTGTAASVGAGKTVGALIASKLVFGTVTFVAGGMVGAGVHSAVVDRPPAPLVAAAPKQEPLPVAPPLVVEAPEPPVAAPPVVAPPKPVRQRAPVAAQEPERALDRDAALASERALLEMARTALSRQKPGDALEALSRHSREFPRGQLGEERDALQVQALVSSGRDEEARDAARRFRLRYPTSLLTPVVEAAEELIRK